MDGNWAAPRWMPPIWLTGISQPLNFAPSSSSLRPRTISSWLSTSCSGKPVMSMASKRRRKSRDLARSASMAAWETSETWSFQRLSPRMEANSGACERVYSHCSVSRAFRASRRACRSSFGASAAQAAAETKSSSVIRNSFGRMEEALLSWPPLYARTGPGVTRRGSALQGNDVEEDGEEVKDAAGEDEHVPDGVMVGQAAPAEEDGSHGVADAAQEQQLHPAAGHREEQGLQGDQHQPSHAEVED